MRCPYQKEIRLTGGARKGQLQTVPCGKCGACLTNRRNDWALRLKEEERCSLNAFFVTLTYAEQVLPISDTGFPTLVKKHLQDFLKRLRHHVNKMPIEDYNYEMATAFESHEERLKEAFKGVRYYAVGEYGEHTYRPHYHLLLFNVPIPIMENLPQVWNYGLCHVGKVEQRSIMYCLSYHITANKKGSEKMERAPEFQTMSRNPGIGHTYVSDYGSWKQKAGTMYVVNDGYKLRMPRYWKDKIFSEEQRAHLTEKIIQKVEADQKKWLDSLEKFPNYNRGFDGQNDHLRLEENKRCYAHSLDLRQAEAQFKKIVKNHKI